MKKKFNNVCYLDRTIRSISDYFADIKSFNSHSQKQEEYEIWKQMREGNMKARDQLINSNLLYVVTVAKKYLWSGVPGEDLIMAGNEGLIIAADRFDASLGYKFISYATWYIEDEIRKTVTDHYKRGTDNTNQVERLGARPNYYSDWDIRYRVTLATIKQGMGRRLINGADMVTDYIEMLQSGLTTSDFKRKHRLTDRQMSYFLESLRAESQSALAA